MQDSYNSSYQFIALSSSIGMEVGLSPGNLVLNGDPASLPYRGTAPNVCPMSVVAKRLDG